MLTRSEEIVLTKSPGVPFGMFCSRFVWLSVHGVFVVYSGSILGKNDFSSWHDIRKYSFQ